MTQHVKTENISATSGDVLDEQIAQLRRLFPEVVVEGKIDFDKLKATLGAATESGPGRFSFTWAGKDDAIALLQTPSRGTLIPSPKESINFDTTGNVFIDGDNLEVLKLLFKPYFGRVKMIYIDPPYNTGKDFIYPDDYTDPLQSYLQLTGQVDAEGNLLTSNPETSGRYHSTWLSMIYPRLFFARQLLRDDGVIFVSIDDHEVHHLRIIMNEIFGEENACATFVWNTEGNTDNQYAIKVNHEYVIAYYKDSSFADQAIARVIDPNTREDSNLRKGFADNNVNKNNPGNPPEIVELPAGFPCTEKKLYYPKKDVDAQFFEITKREKIVSDDIKARYNIEKLSGLPVKLDDMIVEDHRLMQPCRIYGGLANRSILERFIANNCNPIVDDDGLPLRFYINANAAVRYRRDNPTPQNILSVLRNLGTTERTRTYLKQLGIDYDYPKPVQLIEYLVSIGCGPKDGIVLDFFAGSGTTAEAVVNVNKNDQGSRRFICVQLPEKCDDIKFQTLAGICRDRITKVLERHQAEDNGKLRLEQPPADLGFKAFTLAKPNIQQWIPDSSRDPDSYVEKLALFNDPLVSGWTPENVLWEVALREGFGLKTRFEKKKLANGNLLYEVTDPDTGQHFTVCLDDAINVGLSKHHELATDHLFVCRDIALDDTAAANLALQCRLKTI